MSDFKKRILNKLAGNISEGTDWALDKLDRPGRATRAGIGAAQNDEDVWDAVKAQFGENPPEAPSGTDIADKFSEDYDITNPYALTGIATAAEVVDPTMFIPGGQVSKVGKLGKLKTLMGVAEKGDTAADILRMGSKAEHGAEAVNKGASAISQIGKAKVETRNPAELMKVREILSDPKYSHLDEVKKAKMKTGDIGSKDTIVAGDKGAELNYQPKQAAPVEPKPQSNVTDIRNNPEFKKRLLEKMAKDSE